MQTDKIIKEEIRRQLEWEPGLDARKIEVSVEKGIVRLSGTVHSYYEKITAENAARLIAGVRAIADDVQIGIISSDDRTDAQIAESVALALANHRDIDERKIQIIVDQGIVTLEGAVLWNFERKAAAELIAGLKGVRKINNFLVVKPSMPAADIKKAIQDALDRHAMLDPEKIIVEVEGDKVVLRGVVSSLAEGDEVELTAWSAPGVSHVENKLILEINESNIE